jgi:uncharacterized protein YcsI (UPF0317 family)
MAASSAPSSRAGAGGARPVTPAQWRAAIRAGNYGGLTTGLAAGFVQANIAILPARYARDFVGFCRANASACPVLTVGDPGSAALPALGVDIDIRRDLPGYRVYVDGALWEAADIADAWQDDLVTVAIGCWFSMEDALLRAGVRLRHLELGIQGPLFRTSVPAQAYGAFRGPLVVSMRPFQNGQVETVRQVTARFPRVHGAPLHQGDPAALGIVGVDSPDFGEPLAPLAGETPLFWGCGLTALAALEDCRVPFFITHAPGKMLITDLRNEAFEEAS